MEKSLKANIRSERERESKRDIEAAKIKSAFNKRAQRGGHLPRVVLVVRCWAWAA